MCQYLQEKLIVILQNKNKRYSCDCPNKIHLVPLDIHKRIHEGAVFSYKVCNKQIKSKKGNNAR